MINQILMILAAIGLVLSVYAYYVGKKAKSEKKYTALCDINDKISCSKAFTSKYGSHFGISNTIFGSFFYALVFVLALYNLTSWVFYLSVLAVLGTVYLAYLLYVKVKSFCLVCSSIYIINILLLIFSFMVMRM